MAMFKPGDELIVRTARGELRATYSCDGWEPNKSVVVISGEPFLLPNSVLFPVEEPKEIDWLRSAIFV